VKKLTLVFGGGGSSIFPGLENRFKDFDFAILNYWIEGIIMVDIEESEKFKDEDVEITFKEVEWIKPNPAVLQIRFDTDKYNQPRPIGLTESYSEFIQSEFKVKKQSFIDTLNLYKSIYILAYLDDEIVNSQLIDFILSLNHPNCKLILLFPPILSGKARVSNANRILESLIDLDIKHYVIFLQDFIDINQTVFEFGEQCDTFIRNILIDFMNGYEINDKRFFTF
jgi:hypothetical protein